MFDSAGANPNSQIGEDNRSGPPKLFIAEVTACKYLSLKIFGDKFDMRNGTGERDYVQIVDVVIVCDISLDRMRKMKEE
ncbi:UDP-glucose 4-epimerase 5 [Ditylenchus destructor]|nr:UDP-glucose 4-epimerase 5 [Ditylenchus destructor]